MDSLSNIHFNVGRESAKIVSLHFVGSPGAGRIRAFQRRETVKNGKRGCLPAVMIFDIPINRKG